MKQIIILLVFCVCNILNMNAECFNEGNQYPDDTIALNACIDTITIFQYAGEYNLTSGYIDGETYKFYSDEPGYYITIKSQEDQSAVIVEGFSPVTMQYQSIFGDIQMHVNTDEFCGTASDNTISSIERVGCIPSINCDNPTQYPNSTIALNCGPNIITNSQEAGEYNLTSNYTDGLLYEFTSPSPNNYIALRKSSDNAIIAQGISPIYITYQTNFGNIEMHVSSLFNCEETTEVTISSIYGYGCLSSTDCQHQINSGTMSIYCGTNTIENINAGEGIRTDGYSDGISYNFSYGESDYQLTIRDENDNILTQGISPQSLVYQNSFGDIEIHVSTPFDCGGNASTAYNLTIINSEACIPSDDCTAPSANQSKTIFCGTNVIKTRAGYYHVTTGYEEGVTYILDITEQGNYLTLRKASDQTVLMDGIPPLSLNYITSMGSIEVHVTSDEGCKPSPNANLVFMTIQSPECTNPSVDCDNPGQYPNSAIAVIECEERIITLNQFAGEYNVTTGYEDGKLYSFKSENPYYHITLREESTNNVIAQGLSPVEIEYQTSFGDIEMHINGPEDCYEENVPLAAYVTDLGCSPPNDLAFGLAITEWYRDGSSNIYWMELYNYLPIDIELEGLSADINGQPFQLSDQPLNILSGSYIILTNDKSGFENEWLNGTPEPNVLEFPTLAFPGTGSLSLSSNSYLLWSLYYDGGDVFNNSNYFAEDIFSPIIRGDVNNRVIMSGDDLLTGTIGYQSQIFTPENGATTSSASIDGSPLGGNYTTILDTDEDGVFDDFDNCPSIANPNQRDEDNDGIGDVCDDDLVSDGQSIGIGTEDPKYRLHVTDGNLFLDNPKGAIIMRSETKCWIVRVDDNGQMIVVETDCPDGN